MRNYLHEHDSLSHQGSRLIHLGLTGGEPLLHKPETINFFRYARARFPDVYTRLYTSGDLLEEDDLKALREADLNEIRFSIKIDELKT